ncbi:hypothetical protein T310_9165, partial [Rasamsonia emersonii CBS 393.64]
YCRACLTVILQPAFSLLCLSCCFWLFLIILRKVVSEDIQGLESNISKASPHLDERYPPSPSVSATPGPSPPAHTAGRTDPSRAPSPDPGRAAGGNSRATWGR